MQKPLRNIFGKFSKRYPMTTTALPMVTIIMTIAGLATGATIPAQLAGAAIGSVTMVGIETGINKVIKIR